MPPKARRYDDAGVREALSAQWRLLSAGLARNDPRAATRLPGWDVARLAAHVTGNVERLCAALARPEPPRATLSLLGYYTDDAPAPDPEPAFDAAVARASALLDATPADRVVTVGEGDIGLTDYLVTRVVEAVVHGLDLAIPVTPDPAALRITVRMLLDVLAGRQPGRSVEVRVPPYAAVQCIEGPRHTRGTPPNVVECDPVTWVEVACGRLAFAEAVAAGKIAASGARADLSAYLPVL